MNSISLRFYQQLLARLNQMSIRGNRHKMAVYVNLNPDQLPADENMPVELAQEDLVFAFHIMFERNNPDSGWRLVTPLRFTD
ncbi:hypothetical protein [Spirosoma litoris]